MQVIVLPDLLMLLICFVTWPALQLLAATISRKLPDRFFEYQSRFFRPQAWEDDGAVYDRLMKIRRWKHLLPDGGAIIPGGYAKKHLTDYSRENLARFLNESCRAEFSHWAAILPFWIFGLIGPPIIIVLMLLYALAVNMPCIMAQRFNRPRIARVMMKNAPNLSCSSDRSAGVL